MAAADRVARPLRGGSPVPSRPAGSGRSPPAPLVAPFLGLGRSRLQVPSRLLAADRGPGRAGLGGQRRPRRTTGLLRPRSGGVSANAGRGAAPLGLRAGAARPLTAVPHRRVGPAPRPRAQSAPLSPSRGHDLLSLLLGQCLTCDPRLMANSEVPQPSPKWGLIAETTRNLAFRKAKLRTPGSNLPRGSNVPVGTCELEICVYFSGKGKKIPALQHSPHGSVQ